MCLKGREGQRGVVAGQRKGGRGGQERRREGLRGEQMTLLMLVTASSICFWPPSDNHVPTRHIRGSSAMKWRRCTRLHPPS